MSAVKSAAASSGAPQSFYYPQLERSVSDLDVPHRFVGTVLYDVPFFQKSGIFLRTAFGEWQVSTIVTTQSGFPGNVSNNIDTTGTGINSRPDQIAPGKPLQGCSNAAALLQHHSVRHRAQTPSVSLASSTTTSPPPKASSSSSHPISSSEWTSSTSSSTTTPIPTRWSTP